MTIRLHPCARLFICRAHVLGMPVCMCKGSIYRHGESFKLARRIEKDGEHWTAMPPLGADVGGIGGVHKVQHRGTVPRVR